MQYLVTNHRRLKNLSPLIQSQYLSVFLWVYLIKEQWYWQKFVTFGLQCCIHCLQRCIWSNFRAIGVSLLYGQKVQVQLTLFWGRFCFTEPPVYFTVWQVELCFCLLQWIWAVITSCTKLCNVVRIFSGASQWLLLMNLNVVIRLLG